VQGSGSDEQGFIFEKYILAVINYYQLSLIKVFYTVATLMKHFIQIFFFLLIIVAAYGQTPLKLRDSTIKGPQTFAMIVGISKYKYVRPLTYADKDAELFRDYLRSPAGGNVENGNIFCLLNEKATNSNFWSKGFQWIKAKELQKGDRLFIYLAGHGDAIDEDQFFFLGYDCNPGGDKNNYLVSGAIQLFNLKKKIASETSKGVDVIFIMDACRSDELPGGLPGQNFLNTAISEKKVGEIIMLATGAGQESLEDASIGNGHGLFTYYLVDGLTGTADSAGTLDNKITFQEIRSYVDKFVPLVAEQQFKRQQVPYFCCNEYGGKIVGVVDTAYLQKWLKQKRQSSRGPGNSFYGSTTRVPDPNNADTTLIQVYNLFNKAINDNKLTGSSSAEYYFLQMDKRFPGNAYTLDAKSTLAAELINYAQNKVNNYIDCSTTISSKEKQDNFEAGIRLEKAIGLLKEDEPEFASSLENKMFFLKASGSDENSIAFNNAYAALSINPDGAYILNQLALLHLSNKNIDSAVYYSGKAVKSAPKWTCALTTLKLVEQTKSTNGNKSNPKKKVSPKLRSGLMIGGGISMPRITYSKENWRQPNVDYNDSLNSITTTNGGKFDLGITAYIELNKTIAIRPAVQLIYESGTIVYNRKNTTGGPTFDQLKRTERLAINIPLPLVFRFSKKNIDPFISLGPTISFSLKQYNGGSPSNQRDIPMRSLNFLGEGGIGVDIGLKKTSFILSPELRYSHGFSDIKGPGSSLYLNTISSLKKNAFTFSINLRRK